MKWVVDECVSIRYPDKYLGSNFIKSIDVVGPGACDRAVLSLTRRLRRGLITADRRFSDIAVRDAKTVIYHKPDGTRFKIKLTRKKLRPLLTKSVRLTNYVLENDKVVIP